MDGFINLQHWGTDREMEREGDEKIQSHTFSLSVLFFCQFLGPTTLQNAIREY